MADDELIETLEETVEEGHSKGGRRGAADRRKGKPSNYAGPERREPRDRRVLPERRRGGDRRADQDRRYARRTSRRSRSAWRRAN